MRLSRIEFLAMNNPLRRFMQKHFELPHFQSMGLFVGGKDVLEIGCGSGYAAGLFYDLRPKSYVGIDLMPEQITLALKRGLPGLEFRVMDTADLGAFPGGSKDVVVIFGILHHVPEWRKALEECARVLRPGGWLYVEEPDGEMLGRWDRAFGLDHPAPGHFTLVEFAGAMEKAGFRVENRKRHFGFGIFAARKQ